MVSFSFMHTISYLKNAPHRCKHILTVWSSAFSAGCTLQFSTLSSMLFFCYYHHFFNFRLQSSCSLADVPRLILVSLTPIKFSIVNSSLIAEIKFSPFLLETVSVLTYFNLLSLRLIRNMHAIDFARYGYFQI